MSSSNTPIPMPILDPALAGRVATAPISWGVCEVPGWGRQLPVDRVLTEMARLGFTHTELGSAGWLPEEPEPLRASLAPYSMSLLASFVPLVMHRAEEAADAVARAQAAAELLADLGATFFNTAPVTTYAWAPRSPLADDEWRHLCQMMAAVDEICAEHGLCQVVHEHLGCVVETRADVERLLTDTDVQIVLDTGHLALGGFDPVEVATDWADRVGLVHLKDVDLAVASRFEQEAMSLMEAVQAGLFPALGQGDLPLAKVIDVLENKGYPGWYVVEQDCAITGEVPAEGEGPMVDVAISVAFANQTIAPFSGRST